MELEKAIKYAIDGKAILFVGAGFSSEALNLENTTFPLATDFSQRLCTKIGLPPENNLSITSDIYIDSKEGGVPSLIEELRRCYRFKGWGNARETYVSVLNLPWKRIYTTNYDNVCESALLDLEKSPVPTTLSDSVKDYYNVPTIVHLNGYIERLSASTLQNEFKLSSTSYLAEDFIKSDWLTLFKSELNSSQAVIFVGVSFSYDLDLQRIILNSDAYKKKIIFIDRILKKDDNATVQNHLKQKFGTVYNIGVSNFAKKIQEIANEYTPFSQKSTYLSFEKMGVSPKVIKKLKTGDVYSLLRYGDIDKTFIPFNLHNNRYLIQRSAEDDLLRYLADDSPYECIILTSDLANGKSCIIERAAYLLQDMGTSFLYIMNTTTTFDELVEITSIPGNKYIFIENCTFSLEVLRLIKLLDLKSTRTKLVLTTRTALYENTSYKIPQLTGIEESHIIEIPVDNLSSKDIDNFIDLLDWSGAWETFRNYSVYQKRKIIKENYNCHLSEFLLDFIKSKQVAGEVNAICEELMKDRTATTLLLGVCITNLIGLSISLNDLLDILEIQISQATRHNPNIRHFLNFSGDCIAAKSSVFSRYLISNQKLSGQVLGILTKLNLNAHKCSQPERENAIRTALISFSNINLLFTSNCANLKDKDDLIEYYNNLKNLPVYKNNQFFWLQFSIACMEVKEYQRADQYLSIAYDIVEQKNKTHSPFDSYQIDVQKARCLLETAIYENNSEQAFDTFCHAHDLLIDVIRRKKGQQHLVFRQVIGYYNFYNKFKDAFTNSERGKIRFCCNEFLGACSSYKLKHSPTGLSKKTTEEAIGELERLRRVLDNDIISAVGV